MSGNGAGSAIFNLLHMLFTLAAALSFLAGLVLLIYQGFGWLTGSGWVPYALGDAVVRFFGPEAVLWQVTAILNTLPTALVLMVAGFLFNKLGDGFERLADR
ncbi:MAG: hypothetical protein U1E15_08075 [Hyphomicrobiales bacterium]